MSDQSNNPGPEKKLYSVNIAHRFTNAAGEEVTKFREVTIGFSNRKGGLGFKLPQGVSLTSDAEIVIFPIERDQD